MPINQLDDGVNGYLCAPRNPVDLAEKMLRMMALTSAERAAMGQRGWDKMVREFDEGIVIRRYLEAVAAVLGTSRQSTSGVEVREKSG